MSLVWTTDENGDPIQIESNDEVLAHAVNEQGEYLGLVTMGPGTIVATGPPPVPGWLWSGTRWQPPPLTLLELQDIKWGEIKALRAEAIDAPLVTPYGTFDSYAQARNDIADSVLLANNLTLLSIPVSIDFTLADNTVINLDAEAMINVGLMLGDKVQTVRGIATGLRADIYATTAPEQLDDIVWPE